MLNRYHRRHPAAIARLIIGDAYHFVYAKLVRPKYSLPTRLNHILLVNPAHLGDVVISTAILAKIKKKFPESQIDFLAGDWAYPLINGHPGVNQAYFLNHWIANRGQLSVTKKKDHFHKQKRVLAELKKIPYDAIFFLNSYEPSFISLFRGFLCPLIGFDTAGGGPLLSLRCNNKSDLHEVQYQASLFAPWLGIFEDLDAYQPWLKFPAVNSNADIPGDVRLDLNQPYVVIHPWSGNPDKEWPLENWRLLIEALQQYDIQIVLTGHGQREENQAALLVAKFKLVKVQNLVNKLSFDEYTSLVSKAKFVFCVDSVCGHLAGAYDRPAVVITNGISEISRWRPLGRTVSMLKRKVSCSPCYTNPCAQRICITGIDPQTLIDQLPIFDLS